MRQRVLIPLFALACACGRQAPPPPPPLFPLSNAWTASLEHPVEGPLATTPGRLVAHTRDGAVQAFTAADGKRAWRVAAAAGAIGAGDSVVVLRHRDGSVQGFAPDTGRELWRAATSVEGALPPVVRRDRVIVAGRGLAVLDAATGKTVWSVASGAEATAPPAQVGACVLLGESDVLRCRDAATGRGRWEYKARGAILSPPVSDGGDGLLLGTSGREFLSLDLDDGGRNWRWRVGADVPFPAVLWHDLVIFATHENVVYGLKRGGGSMVWRAGLPSRPMAAPLLVGDNVLVACYGGRPEENFLVGFDAPTGDRVGDLRTPGELAAPPIAAAGRLVMALRDRKLVALALPAYPQAPAARPRSLP